MDRNPLLDPGPPLVIGHRGYRAHAPENTLESFRQAVASGVDGLELDVRLTRDGEVVVFHDATLERTTDGSGMVAAHTWDELRRLDAGRGFLTDDGDRPWLGRGIGIPRLAEVLETFPDTPVICEVKAAEAARPTLRVILDRGAEGRVVAGAFRHEILAPFAGSPVPRTASTREVVRLYLPALARHRPRSLPFQVMSLPRSYRRIPVPLGALAALGRPAGVPVHAWTVNDPEVAIALWRDGVRGILTDDPAALLGARAGFKP